jgi:hypothetical protein
MHDVNMGMPALFHALPAGVSNEGDWNGSNTTVGTGKRKTGRI